MEEIASIPAAKLISSPIKVASFPVKTASSPAKPTSSQINIAPTPSKTSPAKPILSESNIAPTPVKTVSTSAEVPSTPAKIDSTPVFVASTPPEFASTPARLIGTSLAAWPQKRSRGSAKPDDVSVDPPTKLARRSTPRSLNFDSYTKDEKAMDVTDVEEIDQVPDEDVPSDDEILSILPDALRQSVIIHL